MAGATGYGDLAQIFCLSCDLRGPIAVGIHSARYWWNLLARLQRSLDGLPDTIPVRNERPHTLDGQGSEPFGWPTSDGGAKESPA